MRAKAYCVHLSFCDLGHWGACANVRSSRQSDAKQAWYSFINPPKERKASTPLPSPGLGARIIDMADTAVATPLDVGSRMPTHMYSSSLDHGSRGSSPIALMLLS
ncbi:hypothetical protein TNCV_279621 [Trichonephila clavipes]|nr:hypothetical protein TNCV_279621 [Trichonephila clavipes]